MCAKRGEKRNQRSAALAHNASVIPVDQMPGSIARAVATAAESVLFELLALRLDRQLRTPRDRC